MSRVFNCLNRIKEHLIWEEVKNGKVGYQVSDLVAVKDERRPAAWTGSMSPNVDMAAADLSLNLPTCPSVSIEPSFIVLSPNLLPT